MTNPDITLGAQIRAIAQSVGMSEDQVVQMVIGAQRKGGRKLGREISTSEAESAVMRRLGKVAAVNEEMPADIDGYSTVANDVIEYGDNYNTDTSQQFGGINKDGRIANVGQSIDERKKAAAKRDPNVFFTKDREGNIVHEEYVPDGQPTPDRFRESEMLRDFGLSADNNTAPAAAVMLDAKRRLESAVAAQGAESLPGALDTIGKLEDSIYGTTAAEQSLAREMVRRDATNSDPEVVEANNWRAQAEARQIAHTSSGSGPVFDQMGDITKIGHAKVADDFNVNMRVPGRETEPNSLPITTPETLNSPVTDNRFAGPLQRQEQWLADNAPGYREGGSFNDYPQVAIQTELDNLGAGLGKIRIGGQGIEPGLTRVRGIDDLQAAVDAVIALSAAKGIGFTRFEDGKNVTATNPGITEVLQKVGYNGNRMDGLARALYAIETGRRSPANQLKKELFAEGISGTNRRVEGGATHESLGGGTVPIAKAGRQKTGGGREVTAAFQALQGDPRADTPLTSTELADARRPYIGAVEGERQPRAQFLSAEGSKMSPQQREATYGPANAAIANRVEQRAADARAAKEASLIPQSDPTSAAFRARDQEFETAGRARNEADNRRALLQAAEDQGKSLVGKGQMMLGPRLGEQQIVPGGMTGRNIVPEALTGRSDAFSAPKADPVVAQKVAVNQEPLSGITYNEGAPDPWTTPPATGGGFTENTEKRMPASMLNALAELNSGPTQGPRTSKGFLGRKAVNDTYGSQSKGKYAPFDLDEDPTVKPSPRRVRQEANILRNRRYGRNAAIAGGAVAGVAGLDAMIGSESERRQEEQY